MEKSEMMKRYEETTYLDDDPQALIQIIEYLKDSIQEYKTKAAAYDRLMSGGKKTLKEWANFLGLCVSINQGGVVFCSYRKPMRVHNGWLLAVDERPRLIIPMELIDYSGNWEDSLTLPDGWEEEICKSK